MNQYVYILINPSLQGLLKIGKTNRSPEERAIELSRSTNMPTPFVVAYEELVPDCGLAERLIHEELQKKGLRVNDGREFFAAPLKDAIRITAAVAENLRNSITENTSSVNEIEDSDSSSAAYYLKMGISAYTGTEDTLQDYNVARECFERALALGENKACGWLAMQHLLGNGVRKSTEQALKLLKQGGDSGDFECFGLMWEIYSGQMPADDSIHKGNAEICYGWYLSKLTASVRLNKIVPSKHSDTLIDYLHHSYDEISQNFSEKLPLSAFRGNNFSKTLDILSVSARTGLKKIRHARILELGLYDSEELTDGKIALIILEMFLSNKTSDGHLLMKEILTGIELADIEYCFADATDSIDTVKRYKKYLSQPKSKEEHSFLAPSAEISVNASRDGIFGFFRRLLR